MITIKSSAYTKFDVIFMMNVLHDGLQTNCTNFFAELVPENCNCDGCDSKTACSELQSAYFYMLSKLKRMEAAENLDKFKSDCIELPDS